MPKLYLDTETCGLHGVAVLLQYAVDDGPILLYEPWKRKVGMTLALLEAIATNTVVGFNLTFDWFHVQKLHALFSLCPPDWIPAEHIDEIAALEDQAKDCDCLKPAGALDLMLHSRKGPYQALMQHDDIRVRRVPTMYAHAVAAELEEKIKIDPIYFAGYKQQGPRWKVYPSKQPGFSNIVLKFNPKGTLKALAEHALGESTPDTFADVELPKEFRPVEFGYAPTASAVSSVARGWRTEIKQPNITSGLAWPGVVAKHIEHWSSNERARTYASNDITYTRGLDRHFGFPAADDDDSVLACMVGSLRWRGYAIDADRLRELRGKAQAIVDASPINVNRPTEVRAYLGAVMTPEESLCIADTTSQDVLKIIRDGSDDPWRPLSKSEACGVEHAGACARCGDSGVIGPGRHPASLRAEELLRIKHAKKEIELYDKLLLAGRLHADFKIIGAKSSRMSGAGGVNAQAIKRAAIVRRCFPLAWSGLQLSGGDFAGFEVTIADAVYQDAELRRELLTGRKIHGLFAAAVYGVPYEEIIKDKDRYTRAKSGVFLDMYGGEALRLSKTLGISLAEAKIAQANWQVRYPGIGRARERVARQFGCLLQVAKGPIMWHEPAAAAHTLLGFPRFFTMENSILRQLYETAEQWVARSRSGEYEERHDFVFRTRGRKQTPEGATATAIYAAAFAMSKASVRAAGNHEIQGTGAGICKSLQRRIWDRQPAGAAPFRVMPMNIHDEIMCPMLPSEVEPVATIVEQTVMEFRQVVPLLGIEWGRKLRDWSSKDEMDGCEGLLVIKPKPEDFPAEGIAA